ncbi:oligosaccharide flippase family protein [Arthrobacter sp. KN11-1C]|uniref:oligosaccharide flippase family protein n=1 Tax=Arthrobacter sp. KN11-1C TaxID=3445774 RepID=UPI003FA18408
MTVVVQFFYAAVTSRAVSPSGFGAYAIALTVTGLISLLSSGGLGQTVSRMLEIDRYRIRALVGYALILGAVSGTVLLLSAPLWASLWGAEAASEPIRWLTISASLSPLVGLATGLMARTGKFRRLAVITALSNIIGMAIGAIAVIVWHSASSLVVSASLAQLFILIGAMLGTDRQLFGFANLRGGRKDISYSGKLVSTSMLSYLTGNIVKFTLARGIDPSILGHWNRAEVLTLIPMQQVQSALIRAVYPEFRHDIEGSSRARTVWTDMLILAAWVSMTLSAIALVLVPPIIPILFGDGWGMAATIAGPLAVVGGLQILATLLGSGVEALGRFRWMVSTEVILILIQVIAAGLILVARDIWVALGALIATNLIRHGWHIFLLSRHGYLDARRLLRHYAIAGGFSTSIALAFWFSLQCIYMTNFSAVYWFLAILILIVPVGFYFRIRNKLPAIVVARRYGLIQTR